MKLHGIPHSIVLDRDKIFTSAFWKELFKLLDTKLLLRTTYHLLTYGQIERVNQCLEMYLRCAISESPAHWRRWLPLAELRYNSSFHSALVCSPFKALYGYDPQVTTTPCLPQSATSSVIDLIRDTEAHTVVLKEHLAIAQNRIKMYTDRK